VKSPQDVVTTLSAVDRVRESMKCVLFRYGDEIVDPQTGAILGRESTLLGDALVRNVQSKMSTLERVVPPEGAQSDPVMEGDQVVTK
jgi:hypothetical protein